MGEHPALAAGRGLVIAVGHRGAGEFDRGPEGWAKAASNSSPTAEIVARFLVTMRGLAEGRLAVGPVRAEATGLDLHRAVIDAAERVTDEESFAVTLRLIRAEGLLVGGSAGTNVAAALRVAARGDIA